MIVSQNAYSRISKSLPILRGWAILWIVAYHLMGNTRGYLVLEDAVSTLSKGGVKNTVESLLELFIAAGSTGVNVFLIISGFGLTASWWKKYGSRGATEIPLMTFWKRRFARIFPPFWVAVAIATILYFINPAWAPFGQDVWQAGGLSPFFAILTTLSTLRNFIPDHYYFLNGAWWYIGLSIQLYLVFPWLIRFGQRYGWRKLLIGSLLFSLAYRAVFCLLFFDDSLIPLAFFPSRLFEFTLGIYLAITTLQTPKTNDGSKLDYWLQTLLPMPQFVPLSLSLFLVGLSFEWLSYSALHIFSEAIIGIGLFYSFLGLSQLVAKLEKLRAGQLSRTLGKYSYGIYLTHMNVYLVLWPMAGWIPSYWLRFLLVAIACCAMGIAFEIGFYVCSKAATSLTLKNGELSSNSEH